MILFNPPELEDLCDKEILLSTIKEEAEIDDPEAHDITIVAVMQIDLSHLTFRNIPTWARQEEVFPFNFQQLGEFHGEIDNPKACIDHIGSKGTYHAFWFVRGVSDVA